MKISKRLDGVSESATLKLNSMVQAMKAQKIDVINFTTGEPDFNVSDGAKAAVVRALETNQSKYTPVPGIAELRQAVADKTNAQQTGLKNPWKSSHVVVSNGGKQAIFNALLALLNPGDEVLIPAPYWLSYPEMVKLAGGTPVFIAAPFQQNFKITPAQLKSAITPRSKILILNSPSNPTGAMYSQAEFRALGEVIREHRELLVISDEIYDRVILGETPFCSFLGANPELAERTITVNGMSKSAAMTGWRIGWSVAPAEVTQAMITLQGQSTSGINSLAQWASLAALREPEASYNWQVESYRKRRDIALEILRKTPKIEVMAPEGAFYLFIGVGNFMRDGKRGKNSFEFAEQLLQSGKVAVVPGSPFGESEFIRISFATDEKTLRDGCVRITEFLS